MDLLIASAPHADTFGYSMPPPGLLRLGGEFVRQGRPVRLEDLAFRLARGDIAGGDQLADSATEWLLRSGRPDILGLSTMGATLPIAIAIAERVKHGAPEVKVLIGGPGAGGIDRELLERFPALDCIVRGEAEHILPQLVDRIAQGAALDVPGVTWRTAGGATRREPDPERSVDLRDVAPYAWELLPPLAEYKAITGEEEGLTPLDSGRGCVYDCSFCSIGRYWRRRSRPLPVDALVAEVQALESMEAARSAYLCHDLFAADRAHALAFCERMIEVENEMPWECRARADHLDAALLERMRAAGCYRVLLGIESADPAVRRKNQKGMRDDFDVLQVVEDCVKHEITPILSLILGLPGEGDPELRTTLEFCVAAALRGATQLSLHLVNPQPGCGLGDEYGPDSRPVAGFAPDMALGAGESGPERELIEAHPDLFSTWALLPYARAKLEELRALAQQLPELLTHYPRTYATLARTDRFDALTLFRAWRASERSFESFVLAQSDPALVELMRFEQAHVRVAARSGGTHRPAAPDLIPRPVAEVVPLRMDLAQLQAGLLEGDGLPAADELITYAITPLAAPRRGAQTLRLNRQHLAVLDLLDGTSLAELDARHPGAGQALTELARHGLVAFHAN